MFATIKIAPRAGGENRKLRRTRSHTHTEQPKKSVFEKDEEEDENGGKT
jgi:hypothetical protein